MNERRTFKIAVYFTITTIYIVTAIGIMTESIIRLKFSFLQLILVETILAINALALLLIVSNYFRMRNPFFNTLAFISLLGGSIYIITAYKEYDDVMIALSINGVSVLLLAANILNKNGS